MRDRGPEELLRPSSRPTDVRVLLPCLAVLLLGGLTACGSDVVVDSAAPAGSAYDGPLTSASLDDDATSVAARGGAAVRALECTHSPSNGGAADYDSGLSTVQDHATAALENWLAEDWSDLPGAGYSVERDDGDRVLLSYDVDGVTKVAVIVADGMRDWEGGIGWGVESWATCDPSELPDGEVAPLHIWVDRDGERAPTTDIVSYPGPEHCDWQEITFLTLGELPGSTMYLGGPAGDLQSMLLTTYAASVPLPVDAVDSGFRSDGRELWIGDDAAYLRSPDSAEAERWPRADQTIACA